MGKKIMIEPFVGSVLDNLRILTKVTKSRTIKLLVKGDDSKTYGLHHEKTCFLHVCVNKDASVQ